MEDKKMFFINGINGEQKCAELLTVLQIDEVEYVVYSIDVDKDFSDVYVARIVKDLDGNDNIVNIEDESEKNKVFAIVNSMIKES